MVDHGGPWWHLLGVLEAQLHTALRRAHRIVVEVELGEEGDRAVSAPRPECDGDLDATAGEGLGAAVSDGDVGRIDDDQRLGAARRHGSRRRARHGSARRSLLRLRLLGLLRHEGVELVLQPLKLLLLLLLLLQLLLQRQRRLLRKRRTPAAAPAAPPAALSRALAAAAPSASDAHHLTDLRGRARAVVHRRVRHWRRVRGCRRRRRVRARRK